MPSACSATTAEEAIGQHISLIIPPDRLDEEADVLARLRRGEKIDHFETVRRAKDGRLVDISLTVSPIKSSDGRIVGASKVARDITERRLADEALSRSRRRYQRIFESAGVSIWDEDFTAVRAALDDLRASGVRDFAAYFRRASARKSIATSASSAWWTSTRRRCGCSAPTTRAQLLESR